MRWWAWLLLAWILLSIPAAVLLGLVIKAAEDEDACAACRHGRIAHDQRNAGTDCALCDCPAFIRSRPQRRARRVHRRAAWRGIPIPRRSSG
jgi:hypothetical protein